MRILGIDPGIGRTGYALLEQEGNNIVLKECGCFYLSVKKGFGELIEEDTRYEGGFEKFWSFFEEEELKELLHTAKFKLVELTVVEKSHAYQSHPYLRAFCQKE